MLENFSQRIAFIVNPLAGDELQAGSRDVSRIHLVLTDPKWGKCQTKNSKLKHECKSKKEFNEFFSGIHPSAPHSIAKIAIAITSTSLWALLVTTL